MTRCIGGPTRYRIWRTRRRRRRVTWADRPIPPFAEESHESYKARVEDWKRVR